MRLITPMFSTFVAYCALMCAFCSESSAAGLIVDGVTPPPSLAEVLLDLLFDALAESTCGMALVPGGDWDEDDSSGWAIIPPTLDHTLDAHRG